MTARWMTPLLLLLTVGAFLLSLMAGKVWIWPTAWLSDAPDGWIFLELRLPRALLGLGIGAVLGLSGAVLQGYLRNPLADPTVLGVSSSAAAIGALVSGQPLVSVRTPMVEDDAPTASNTLEEYEQQIQRLGTALTKIILETPGLFRILLLEATSIDPEMTQRIMAFFNWCASQVAAYFENGVKQGHTDFSHFANGSLLPWHCFLGIYRNHSLRFCLFHSAYCK